MGGHALGFNTGQLNRTFDQGGVTNNQIRALHEAGYFSSDPGSPNLMRAWAPAADTTSSREYRVRSYLAANCAQCHQPGGTAQGSWDARLLDPLSAAGIINGTLSNPGGDTTNRVVKPWDPAHSMLLKRIANFAPLPHMPPLATSVVNEEAVALLTDWIATDLAGYRTFSEWQTNYFGSSAAGNAQPDADPDGDGASNQLEYLARTNPNNNGDGWKISISRLGTEVGVAFSQIPNVGFEVQATTNRVAPFLWQPLDTPENRPFFPATGGLRSVRDVFSESSQKYYRVRVFEP